MPLDVTHKALVTAPRNCRLPRLARSGRPGGRQLDRFLRTLRQGKNTAPPVRRCTTPCTIAYLLQPDLFTGRHINVEIETGSDLTLGMTVADWWRVTGRAPNALFIGDVDADGFFTLLTERLARL